MAIDIPSNLTSNGSTHHDHTQPSQAHILRQIYPILGLFLFYILHDALQERMFRYDGFTFGFFMTLVEVLVMLVASSLLEKGCCRGTKGSVGGGVGGMVLGSSLEISVLGKIGIVGLFLALAHGLGNTALRYSPYPLKVAFKSSKLVPTMALGACVTGRKHTALQYTAALVMGMGLAVLTAADVFTSTQNKQLQLARNLNIGVGGESIDTLNILANGVMGPLLGPTLLMISTFFDSVVPNLQEQLLQTAKVKTSEMIFVSNSVMCLVLVGYTTYSREMMEAWNYCIQHRDVSLVLLLQGLSAYLGLQCYLAIIRDHGGVVAVLLANGRKIATIILSFMLFAKPFNSRHFVGLVLVFLGVYLGYISKKGETTTKSRKKAKGQKSKGNNRPHEHKV
ncbi:hypothetical protein ACHAW6_007471 [Cyclotella cf. meneghiniana]